MAERPRAGSLSRSPIVLRDAGRTIEAPAASGPRALVEQETTHD